MLTRGKAHQCPVAERLIDRVQPAECWLGDKAYDSNELRDELEQRGTKPVIPNHSNPQATVQLQHAPLQATGVSRARSTGWRTLENALRQARSQLLGLFLHQQYFPLQNNSGMRSRIDSSQQLWDRF
jgi:hypothetical protein